MSPGVIIISIIHVTIVVVDKQDDQSYLIKRAGVGHIIKPEWKNPTRGVQTKDAINNYFSQLAVNEIQELYQMYR